MRSYRLRLQINGKCKELNIVRDNVMLGINSGQPFKNQYVFLDKDNMTEFEVINLGRELIHEENFRRVAIVKSTDKHNGWHLASFSVVPYPRMIDILSRYLSDGGHIAKSQDNGFATLRVTKKNGFKPVLYAILNNTGAFKQLNFYDYNAERAYLKMLGMEFVW